MGNQLLRKLSPDCPLGFWLIRVVPVGCLGYEQPSASEPIGSIMAVCAKSVIPL